MTEPIRNRYKGVCAKCGCRLGIEEGYYMGQFSRVYYTKDGEKRERWRIRLQATDAEIRDFGHALRFDLSYSDRAGLEERLDDRMGKHGLKAGRDAHDLICGEMRRRIIAGGDAKRFTRGTVLEIIQVRDLRATRTVAPKTRLFVHAWAKQAFDIPPTIELNWTSHFDREKRRIASPAEWESDLLPQLRNAGNQLADMPNGRGKYVDLRGKVPLTTSLAIGSVLSEVAGFKLRVEQPTLGETHLWCSDASRSDAALRVVQEHGTRDEDLVVGFGISGSALADIERFRSSRNLPAVVYAEPAGGPGNQAVSSAGDVVALAFAAREMLREKRIEHRAIRVHLILYAPSSFAAFLGQRLNALGTIITYERGVNGSYQQSVVLQTG